MPAFRFPSWWPGWSRTPRSRDEAIVPRHATPFRRAPFCAPFLGPCCAPLVSKVLFRKDFILRLSYSNIQSSVYSDQREGGFLVSNRSRRGQPRRLPLFI